MNIIEYYIDLRCEYSAITEMIPFQVTTQEIAEVFCCTLRNTRYLLKKMESEGFLIWEPGKGRGNPSKMTFLCPMSTLVYQHFQKLIEQNDIKQAFQLINKKGISSEVRKKCYQTLRPEFGFEHYETVPLNLSEDLSEKSVTQSLTMKHMVNQINSYTSKWVISQKPSKPSALWPMTKKHKF